MTQPAAAPDASPSPAAATPAPAAPSWLEGAAPESSAWVSEHGMKSVDELVSSHRGLVKLKGAPAEELIHLKKGWSESPESEAAVYARLGRPEKAEQYEIPDIPVADGQTNLAPKFKEWAHAAGLNPKQATALATAYQRELADGTAARKTALEAKLSEEEIALKAEWGGAFEENVAAGSKAARTLAGVVGLSEADLNGMFEAVGYGKTMKMLATIGRTMGEHKTVTGAQDPHAFGMTPAAAKGEISKLRAELIAMKREDPRYQGLLAEITRLGHLATGEEVPGYLVQP